MNCEEMVFDLRKRIFEEWRWKRYTWQEIKVKYGFSKKWFYKWLKRFLKYGEEGLRNKVRKKPSHPHALSLDQKIRILDYVYENPTHGPDRIAAEQIPRLSGKTVWKYLKRENLNSRRKRKLWAHYQGKPVLTEKEKLCLKAKERHVESNSPGELVSIDTFWLNVKNLGKVFQYTACDTYSSYGWAKCYWEKTSDNAVDFFIYHILKNSPGFKIKRVLTDQGCEFYSPLCKNYDPYFTSCLKTYSVKHSVTKVAHPWTNGYAERLNQTIWQEFYLCRLTHPFASLEILNRELQNFMTEYNFKRRHTGYKLTKGGYEYPGHAFFDVRENSNIVEIKY
jgi:transposase InsO family protein